MLEPYERDADQSIGYPKSNDVETILIQATFIRAELARRAITANFRDDDIPLLNSFYISCTDGSLAQLPHVTEASLLFIKNNKRQESEPLDRDNASEQYSKSIVFLSFRFANIESAVSGRRSSIQRDERSPFGTVLKLSNCTTTRKFKHK